MHSSQFRQSTAHLVWGVILLVIGQVVWSSGQRIVLEDALNPYSRGSDGGGFIGVGVVLVLVGLVQVVVGLWRLSTNVDLAAKVAADVLSRQERGEIAAGAAAARAAARRDDEDDDD